jgi:mono/diheme cytochrome c family protein
VTELWVVCAPVKATRSRLARTLALAASGAVLALAAGGCAHGRIQTHNSADHQAAVSFNQHCSGCHSLDAANAYGSKPKGTRKPGERTDGPNFNQRKVASKADALFAIRNGGFSGAIMPANIVTGKEAEQVAAFVAKYSAREPQ